jgi:hypothetical protein
MRCKICEQVSSRYTKLGSNPLNDEICKVCKYLLELSNNIILLHAFAYQYIKRPVYCKRNQP